jgi:hypothetical protein
MTVATSAFNSYACDLTNALTIDEQSLPQYGLTDEKALSPVPI